MRFSQQLLRKWCAALVAAAVTVALGTGVEAGDIFHGNFNRNNVGGILIDADGVIRNLEVTPEKLKEVVENRRNNLEAVPENLQQKSPLRKVSLKRLFGELKAYYDTNIGDPPQELTLLGGLLQVQYVLVYPDDNDIVLAGPGEGWVINHQGDLVGETTGRPLLHLDDLIVALRSAYADDVQPISCSIDPRPEGIQKLRAYLEVKAKERQGLGPDPAETLAAIEKALGPQTVTVTGVPDTSRFARILIGADYKMKRFGMGFEPAPVRGMPSFLQMVRTPDISQMMPRWWLAPKYDAIAVSEDGLAYELRGSTVQALTEDELVTADGDRTATGRTNPVAKKWADTMTAKYEELSEKEPIFASLSNCIDLAVVAALFRKHDLPGQAGFQDTLDYALKTDRLLTTIHNPPHTVSTQASAVKKGRNWIVSASGGVDINPWEIIKNQEKVAKLSEVRDDAIPPAGAGWVW